MRGGRCRGRFRHCGSSPTGTTKEPRAERGGLRVFAERDAAALLRSYGETSTSTRSPCTIWIKCLCILPAMCAILRGRYPIERGVGYWPTPPSLDLLPGLAFLLSPYPLVFAPLRRFKTIQQVSPLQPQNARPARPSTGHSDPQKTLASGHKSGNFSFLSPFGNAKSLLVPKGGF